MGPLYPPVGPLYLPLYPALYPLSQGLPFELRGFLERSSQPWLPRSHLDACGNTRERLAFDPCLWRLPQIDDRSAQTHPRKHKEAGRAGEADAMQS